MRKRRQTTGAKFSSLLLPRSRRRVVPEYDDEQDIATSILPQENPNTSSDAPLFKEQRIALDVLPQANMSASLGAPRLSQEVRLDDAFDKLDISVMEASGTRAATKVIDAKEKPPPAVTKFGSGTGFCRNPRCIGCQLRRIERQERQRSEVGNLSH